MEELLDLTRSEFEAARWFMDEETSYQISVEAEVREAAFERFMLLRSFVQQCQFELRSRYLAIGYALLEIKRDRLYNYVAPKDRGGCGYSSFKKFCKEVFNLAESTSKKLVRVAEAFCVTDGKLDARYMSYSFSQLAELLTVDKQYWPRITSSCSVRDIRHLGELYKEYVPTENSTVEKDLAEWRKIHDEKQASKNAKKNALRFIPAHSTGGATEWGSTSNPAENRSDQPENDEFDGEDERDLSTPDQHRYVPFSSIKDGLFAQLELLRNCEVGVAWKKCADIFEEALQKNAPNHVARHKEVVDAKIEICNLKEKLENVSHVEVGNLPPPKKVTLRDGSERKEWVKNFRSFPLWIDVPALGKRYYRYDFINGDALVVEVGVEFYVPWNAKEKVVPYHSRECVRYAIISEERPLFDCGYQGGVSGIVDWLTRHSKEI